MDIEKLHNKKIDILGTPFKIILVDEIKKDDGEGFMYGSTSSSDYTIKIARYAWGDKLPKDQMEITFLHELTHAICGTGCYLSYNNDEQFVEWMARCLYKLIKSNLFK